MTTNYNVTGAERKALVKAIADHLGEKAQYQGMPSCAFRIGDFTVTREGTLEFDDRTDSELVEGLYEAIAAAGFTFEAPEESATEAADAPTEAQEDETTEALETGEEPETTDSAEASESENGTLTISLPMTGHTGNSLRNLISMLFSRGRLISKATGGIFGCTEELSDALRDENSILTTDSLRKAVADFEAENGKALTGLSFEDDKVSFTGFPFTDDAEKVQAFQQLACQMNKLAKEQKRTLAREVDESNERYIFRIWLLRLGMAGSDFKSARRVLLSPLSGNAAFKDSAMEDRWKANQNAKRDALKAARAETEVTEDAVSE